METTIRHSRGIVRVAVVGPESSGKSTLSKQLAAHFKTVWVREFARKYLEKTEGKYSEEDLLTIAKGQIALESELEKSAPNIIIADTDLITIKIWGDYKYGRCDPWIISQIQNSTYDLHLLCTPDFPWEADSLRENPHDREHLYNLYKNELLANDFPFVEIKGEKAGRLKTATEAIYKII